MATTTKIKLRRGLLADLQNIQLDDGELGVTTDTKELYVGVGGVNNNLFVPRETIVPINYNNKASGVGLFSRISGTGTLSYDPSESTTGVGCFAITGNGTWVINNLYAASPSTGLGGKIIVKGTATFNVGCQFYTSSGTYITPTLPVQNSFIMSGNSIASFIIHEGNTKYEGTVANTMPAGTKLAQPFITITGNAGTVKFDEFDIYRLNSSVGVEPTQNMSGTLIDWSTGNVFSKSIASNTTFTFSNYQDGQVIAFRLINSSASTLTITWPTMSGADTVLYANKTKVYTLFVIGSTIYSSALEF